MTVLEELLESLQPHKQCFRPLQVVLEKKTLKKVGNSVDECVYRELASVGPSLFCLRSYF